MQACKDYKWHTNCTIWFSLSGSQTEIKFTSFRFRHHSLLASGLGLGENFGVGLERRKPKTNRLKNPKRKSEWAKAISDPKHLLTCEVLMSNLCIIFLMSYVDVEMKILKNIKIKFLLANCFLYGWTTTVKRPRTWLFLSSCLFFLSVLKLVFFLILWKEDGILNDKILVSNYLWKISYWSSYLMTVNLGVFIFKRQGWAKDLNR